MTGILKSFRALTVMVAAETTEDPANIMIKQVFLKTFWQHTSTSFYALSISLIFTYIKHS